MTEQNPIDLDEMENEQQVQKESEYEQKRQKFLKVHKNSPFNILMEVIKLDMTGSELEKDTRLKNRIRKYFEYGEKKINLSNHEHFCSKRMPDYSDSQTYPIANQIVIFGVDFLNKKKILKMFEGLNPEVVWMDASHCKIVFSSPDDARCGIKLNLLNKQEQEVKLEEEEIQVPKGWFDLKPYEELTFVRNLQCRYATSNENETGIQHSRDYLIFSEARKKFEENIAKQAQPVYEKYLKKFGIERSSNRNRQNRDSECNRSSASYKSNDRFRRDHRKLDRDQSSNNYRSSRERSREKKHHNRGAEQKMSTNFNSNEDELDDNFSYILHPDEIYAIGQMQIENEVSMISVNYQEDDISNPLENLDLSFPQLEKKDQSFERKPINTSFSYAQYVKEQEQIKLNSVSYMSIEDDD